MRKRRRNKLSKKEKIAFHKGMLISLVKRRRELLKQLFSVQLAMEEQILYLKDFGFEIPITRPIKVAAKVPAR